MTSVTTLLALLALYFLGGDVIRGFTFAMIWGVLVGTYSSIFVAAKILLIPMLNEIGMNKILKQAPADKYNQTIAKQTIYANKDYFLKEI